MGVLENQLTERDGELSCGESHQPLTHKTHYDHDRSRKSDTKKKKMGKSETIHGNCVRNGRNLFVKTILALVKRDLSIN